MPPWTQYAFDPAETPLIGHRGRDWTAVGVTEAAWVREIGRCLRVACVREMARCLREIGTGQSPRCRPKLGPRGDFER